MWQAVQAFGRRLGVRAGGVVALFTAVGMSLAATPPATAERASRNLREEGKQTVALTLGN